MARKTYNGTMQDPTAPMTGNQGELIAKLARQQGYDCKVSIVCTVDGESLTRQQASDLIDAMMHEKAPAPASRPMPKVASAAPKGRKASTPKASTPKASADATDAAAMIAEAVAKAVAAAMAAMK